jgi:hypothetical protein
VIVPGRVRVHRKIAGPGVQGMLEKPNVRNNSYLVPCVFKAVQMVEALRKTRAGLRVEDFLNMTGYSRSTIYRILRTLVACGYIARDNAGVYHLNHAVINVADENAWPQTVRHPDAPTTAASESHLEFERWGVRFRIDGKKAEPLPTNGAAAAIASQPEA